MTGLKTMRENAERFCRICAERLASEALFQHNLNSLAFKYL
jgi:hypothetical protein